MQFAAERVKPPAKWSIYLLLGICFWREGFEAAFGPDRMGEKGGCFNPFAPPNAWHCLSFCGSARGFLIPSSARKREFNFIFHP